MADEVADAFGGPSFSTLMTLLVLILCLWVAIAGAIFLLAPPSLASSAALPGAAAPTSVTRGRALPHL